MNSFRDPVTGVLKAFGCVDFNAEGDLVREEPDGFDLEPGKWQLEGDQWVVAVPTPAALEEIKRHLLAEAATKRDILLGHLRWFYTKAAEEVADKAASVAQAAADPALGLPGIPENQAAIAAAQVALASAQSAHQAAVSKRSAIETAINSLQTVFTDPRVVAAVDGEVRTVLATIKNEIGLALAQASPATYMALLALDPL